MALLAAHPLVRRVTPHLDGDVSVVGGAVRDALSAARPGRARPGGGGRRRGARAGWAGSWAAA